MKLKFAATLSLLGLLVLTNFLPSVFAANINQRQWHEQQRINNGVRNGSLSPAEAHNLQAHQYAIQRKEDRYRADGNLSPAERYKLKQAESRQSQRIYNQKHDYQSR